MTNPTNEHREQAREIVYADVNIARGQSSERLVERVAAALSSRDAEIREVLEGLSKVLTFKTGPPQRCWCDAWVHTAACLAARDLYAKLQPNHINGASSTPKG